LNSHQFRTNFDPHLHRHGRCGSGTTGVGATDFRAAGLIGGDAISKSNSFMGVTDKVIGGAVTEFEWSSSGDGSPVLFLR
jgi:hypothetical protein